MKIRLAAITLAVLLVALLLAWVAAPLFEPAPPPRGLGEPQIAALSQFIPADPPRPAPGVPFQDRTGGPASLADFRGRLVLVNLWATWCGPCVEEMPALERAQAKLGERLTILAVSEDRGGAKVVDPFLEKQGLAKLRIFLDPKGEFGRAVGIRGLPTSLLVDAEGRELGRVEGQAEWDGANFLGLLQKYADSAGQGSSTAAR
jgi:thiol-disulfide isomerase/thioredoxin